MPTGGVRVGALSAIDKFKHKDINSNHLQEHPALDLLALESQLLDYHRTKYSSLTSIWSILLTVSSNHTSKEAATKPHNHLDATFTTNSLECGVTPL
ncbi:hypothetical protein RJF_3932 [Candidozyma auris]|nr:hypothetical protein QG37_06588 [[Candida] auris]